MVSAFGLFKVVSFHIIDHFVHRVLINVPAFLSSPDGPLNVTISGPSTVLPASSVTLNCTAASLPACTFIWFYNGNKVANTSVYKIPSIAKNQSGEYTCSAVNNVTTNVAIAKWTVTVIGKFFTKKNILFSKLFKTI